MDVSKNSGTPKSSILIGVSIINHPFYGTSIFGNTFIDWVLAPSNRWFGISEPSTVKNPYPPQDPVQDCYICRNHFQKSAMKMKM